MKDLIGIVVLLAVIASVVIVVALWTQRDITRSKEARDKTGPDSADNG